jgi:beta-mannosidase
MLGEQLHLICDGWELVGSPPSEREGPRSLSGLRWMPATVPGTVAGALTASAALGAEDLDASDWWFRTTFTVDVGDFGERLRLRLDGVATVSEVYLDGERLLESESMFARHALPVTLVSGYEHELVICCRALRPLLAQRRRPRARWRTALVADGNLRFHRTMVIGRAPGFAPGPPVVGPYRPVAVERHCGVSVQDRRLRAVLDGQTGRVTVRAGLRRLREEDPIQSVALELDGGHTRATAQLDVVPDAPGTVAVNGELRIAGPEQWWPHTHGRPALYGARLLISTVAGEHFEWPLGRVGFRDLRAAPDLEGEGLRLSVNGVPIFARGAVWTPPDDGPAGLEPDPRRARLQRLADAGMNMVRIPGTACYETPEFHDLCDELGILVWQDFMFANLDYPDRDAAFMATVEREARQVLDDLGGRPSLAVLCGGSEVAQQVAMLGLDPALADGPLYRELLPRVVREAGVQAPYVPSSPWGGDLPFRPDRGVAHYFGVGGYRRPLEDARRAEVKFASECLAFANVPDDDALEGHGPGVQLRVGSVEWKRGVPRDAGAAWDFEDVRDHYLQQLFDVDPVTLRSFDPERYLDLSRQVSGEVMAEVFGEWRRAGSPCAGGIVLWLADLQPGAGWGVLDHRGQPKVAFHHLRRALAPIAVWSTDEGLGGVVAHIANDRPHDLRAKLRISLYRHFETLVEEETVALEVPAFETRHLNVEAVLGRFVDVSWAYRFGPPAQDVIVLSLEDPDDGSGVAEVLSQSCRFVSGRPLKLRSPEGCGVSASVRTVDGESRLTVTSEHFLYGVRAVIADHLVQDDAFFVEPGRPRALALRRCHQDAEPTGGSLRALNLDGRVAVEMRT